MCIYFDCAATTPVSELAIEKSNQIMRDYYANPSSIHSFGLMADNEISNAKKSISRLLSVTPKEIYFTSGGTEANNLILFGLAKKNSRVITVITEHPSVYEVAKILKQRGTDVVFLPTDSNGNIILSEFEESLQCDSANIVISIMHVNNEIGVIQDIEAIGKIIEQYRAKRNIVFHSDCVQSFGKLQIPTKWLDTATFSGHKINAPKGVGGLYIKNGLAVNPIFFGGEQELRLRPGTQNTPAIGAMGVVCENIDINKNFDYIMSLKMLLLSELTKKGVRYIVAGDVDKSSPYITNISFLDTSVRGETIVHYMEQRGIFISTTSACTSKKSIDSRVHIAMGYKKEIASRFVRVSFDTNCTKEQVMVFADTVKQIIGSEIIV